MKAGRDPFKIKDGIYWVATLDPDLKIFDIIMRTAHGSTYNSYLVEGTNKKAIVDAVKEPFFEGFLENLEKLKDIKFNMSFEPFRVRFRPTNEDLQKAFEIGKQLGQKVKEMP